MAHEAEGEVDVPPTLQALLAARLDQLDPAASGRPRAWRGRGRALPPRRRPGARAGEAQVTPRLVALVRKQLIRPDTAQFAGEDAFRFRHLLIRDAAYDALPKAIRAELHERFADWLEERGSRSRRAGRDPWPPPRAGSALQGRAREAGRRARRTGCRAARRRRSPRPWPWRRSRCGVAARALARAHPPAQSRRPSRGRPGASPVEPTRGGLRAIADERPNEQRLQATAQGRRSHASSLPGTAWSSRTPRRSSTRSRREALPLLEEADDHAGLAHSLERVQRGRQPPRPLGRARTKPSSRRFAMCALRAGRRHSRSPR